MLKKHLAALAIILTLPATAMAGQIGGLADHMGGQLLTVTVSVGVIDRDIKRNGVDDDFKMNVLSARATYGLNERIDLYATLGKGNIDGFSPVDDSLEDIYGGGVKFLLFEGVNKTRVILNADANFMETSDADYYDVSGSVIISKKRGNLTPYGGVKVSAVEIDVDGITREWEEEKGTGFFAGVDYFVNPNVYFTGEIHVFAENTIFAGVGYNF